jgi:predicted alpha/beta hydrolase family esterase
MKLRPIILLPGFGNSGPAHWQSRWQEADDRISRFNVPSWERPVLDEWLEALDRAVTAAPAPPILVSHSLSGLLIAHWAARGATHIAGAMLVAVPDPARPDFPAAIVGFQNPPKARFAFPAMVIASSNDSYDPSGMARTMAEYWGAQFVDAGAQGHINPAAGITDWPEGRALLAVFEKSLPYQSPRINSPQSSDSVRTS